MTNEPLKLYSRADLVALDGVDDGALPFWFREGLLVPLPAEPRKHRRFCEGEAKIAALLGEARNLGLNITVMRHIAANVRAALEFHTNLMRSLGGGASLDLQAEYVERESLDAEALWLAWDVLNGENAIGVRPGGGGAWLVRSMPLQFQMQSRVEVIFNLPQIFAPLKGGGQ